VDRRRSSSPIDQGDIATGDGTVGVVSNIPLNDDRGGSLVSFAFQEDNGCELSDADNTACSLVIVQWDRRVLMGFNVSRNTWELPGGSLDPGESAREAALRELAEETGIRDVGATMVARAEFTFEGNSTRYRAAVFAVVLDCAPDLIKSDELCDFRWWDPDDELWHGMNILDAEVVRQCGLHA
jgi:8-oxo-dGTP diphosphatase